MNAMQNFGGSLFTLLVGETGEIIRAWELKERPDEIVDPDMLNCLATRFAADRKLLLSEIR